MPETEIDVAGERLMLLPERAAYWPARRTLIVADLDWGKTELFRQLGIPLPDGALEDELDRLCSALQRTSAQRLMLLGDLSYAKAGLVPFMVEAIAQFFAHRPGQHTRAVPWRLKMVDGELREGPFAFARDPVPRPGAYTIAGRLRPMLHLQEGAEEARLPCFWFGPQLGVLPSFSGFSQGVPLRAGLGERLYVLAGSQIIEV